jgi:hypothetical protein
MLTILKVGLGLMGLLLLVMGGRWIFSLEKMMAGYRHLNHRQGG